MKKLLIAVAAVIITAASTYAQAVTGTINFNTRFPAAGVDAPVFLGSAASGQGPGPSYSAALYLVDGSNLTLIPSSVTTFRAPGAGAAAVLDRYVQGVVAEVPGRTAGQSATVRMRAWQTSAGSFEAAAATQRGESDNLVIASLGGGAAAPADLPASTVFTGFVIPIPEPSTVALGVLGAAALLLRRRK